MPPTSELRKVAEADFPSRFGHFPDFRICLQHWAAKIEEVVALKMGDLELLAARRWCRSIRKCLTGDVFHSLRCDCRGSA